MVCRFTVIIGIDSIGVGQLTLDKNVRGKHTALPQILCDHCSHHNVSKIKHRPHSYGKSHAIWDHTLLPATRQRWLFCLYPSRSWYLIYRPQRDARLSWPRWWLHLKIVYLPKMVTYLRNNQAMLWPGLEPSTRKSQVQRSNHYTIEPPNTISSIRSFIRLQSKYIWLC